MSDELSNFEERTQTLAERIEAARLAIGMSREELAAQMGCMVETVEGWENGDDEPRANRLMTLAGMLNVSMIWLLSGESNGTTNVEDGISREAVVNDVLGEINSLRAMLRGMIERLDELEARIMN